MVKGSRSGFFSFLMGLILVGNLVACSNSGSASPTKAGDKPVGPDGASKPTNPKCQFAEVDMPGDLSSYFPEGIDPDAQGAYRNYDCKTIAVAFAKYEQRFVVARFNGTKLDETFGENGIQRFEFLKAQAWMIGKIRFVEMPDQIAMVGSALNKTTAGFAVGVFNLQGQFQDNFFYKGAGYVNVYSEPATGTSCTRFSLTIKGMTVVKDQLQVSGIFNTVCWNENAFVTRTINTKFPDVSDLKKEIPKTCQDYNYTSPGAVNSEAHEFYASKDCSSIRVSYHYVGWGLQDPSWSEEIYIQTNGKCSTSKRFGYSCFYYENGFLARESVDKFWQSKKTYLSVVKNRDGLCGVSGTGRSTYMVESSYVPTDSKFYRSCRYF